MKKKKCRGWLVLVCLFFGTTAFSQDQPVWRVNDAGKLTINGNVFIVKGGSWFGLEGRFEPLNDLDNPGGAPMEQYVGNVFWSPTDRNYDLDIRDFKALGFNLIRLPLVPQTLDPDDPQGRAPFLKNHDSVIIENARLALETIIKKLDEAGLYVLLDLHSCSNYLGRKAGRLDARPPYPKTHLDNWDLSRDECSCSLSNNPPSVSRIQAYDEEKWLNDLQTLAGLPYELGVDNIIGIDIFNEPWDYTWEEWRDLIDKAYDAIDEVNPNILIFAQGISSQAGLQDGTPEEFVEVPHGDEFSKPFFGENLYEAGENPPSMPKNRLVFSPHCFGPSVFVQSMFLDPEQTECLELEGEEAARKRCDIVINPEFLEKAWEEHFGYLKRLGYAVVIGEFGGNPDWPDNAPRREQELYDYLPDKQVDWQWQNAFASYLRKRGIYDSIYWAINPEFELTGGIFKHAYDPVSNIGGWGTWAEPDKRRTDLLNIIWPHVPPPTPTSFSSPTPIPDLIPGDVNGDRSVNILDSLLIAQYYVGLIDSLIFEAADVNCDYSIDIVDALNVAQYYVGQDITLVDCLID